MPTADAVFTLFLNLHPILIDSLQLGETTVSIVRVGLAETKNFAEGFDAIFGKKKAAPRKKSKAATAKSKARKRSKRKG